MTERRPLPAWLVGLLIAIVLFVLFLLVTSWLGVGDDPAVEEAVRFRA
ncbi:MAG TPA: hypothetical protein VF246_03110 [Acidimicrobiia bacterium]